MNPNPNRFNKERWDYGKQSFTLVCPIIEEYLEEPLIETKMFYEIMDAKTETYDIEVKSRTPKYHWKDEYIMRDGWLLPKCKIDYAKKSQRPFLFFYWWRRDNSLWEWEFNLEDLKGLEPFVPPWHKEKQEHYYIPFKCWKELQYEDD